MLSQYQKIIQSMVYKIAGHQLGKADIEDVISSINLKLLETDGAKSLSAYNAAAGMELTTFVGMVAKCEAVDALRRIKNTVAVGDEQEDEDQEYYTPVDAEADALSALVHKEQAAKARKAITMLSEEDQHFLAVIMCDDYSTEEHAQQLGISVANLKVKKHRIIAKLRKIISNLYRDVS